MWRHSRSPSKTQWSESSPSKIHDFQVPFRYISFSLAPFSLPWNISQHLFAFYSRFKLIFSFRYVSRPCRAEKRGKKESETIRKTKSLQNCFFSRPPGHDGDQGLGSKKRRSLLKKFHDFHRFLRNLNKNAFVLEFKPKHIPHALALTFEAGKRHRDEIFADVSSLLPPFPFNKLPTRITNFCFGRQFFFLRHPSLCCILFVKKSLFDFFLARFISNLSHFDLIYIECRLVQSPKSFFRS